MQYVRDIVFVRFEKVYFVPRKCLIYQVMCVVSCCIYCFAQTLPPSLLFSEKRHKSVAYKYSSFVVKLVGYVGVS